MYTHAPVGDHLFALGRVIRQRSKRPDGNCVQEVSRSHFGGIRNLYRVGRGGNTVKRLVAGIVDLNDGHVAAPVRTFRVARRSRFAFCLADQSVEIDFPLVLRFGGDRIISSADRCEVSFDRYHIRLVFG